MGQKSVWVSEIVGCLIELGGYATLEEIYQKVKQRSVIDFKQYKDWRSRIRNNIYLHSSDCDIFIGGDNNDIFYSINGKGKGIWGLRSYDKGQI